MRLSDLSFFNLASRRMNWLGARQQVIAQNVANSDTPGFRAQDVTPFADVLRSTGASGVRTTNSRHIAGLAGARAEGVGVNDDPDAYEESLDGNNVALEQQTIKSTEVTENYRLAAQLYRKGHEMLTLAATGVR
ncbi:flagellar basal body rod protein FlgB [Pseudooceanicola sp. MF1-13]|uniref:flagellar basal body rod protein FlgB n=1 Tax=Pseudooceanicola sp. MF1-13 TaxID=3379095 RepID=UPI003891E87B